MTIINESFYGVSPFGMHIKKEHKKLFIEMAKVIADSDAQECMFQMIISNLLNVVKLITKIAYNDKFYKSCPQANLIFSWSMSNFRKRMAPHVTYVDVLRLEHTRTLTIAKLLIDFGTLERLLIVLSLHQVNWAKIELLGCKRVLELRDFIGLQNNHLKRLLTYYSIQTCSVMPNHRWLKTTEMNNKLKSCIEKGMDDQLVYGPILLRYIRNYQLTNLEGLEHALSVKMEKIAGEGSHLDDTVERNESVFRNSMQFYSNLIETLRNNITYWSWKYETDYDKVDNDVIQSELMLKTLSKTMKDHQQRLEFYRSELDRFYENQRKEKELWLEKLRIEQEKAELRKSLHKNRKSKSKERKKSAGSARAGKGKK